MSELSETGIQQGLQEAMKAKAMDRVMVLRGLLAAIKNLKIERRGGGAPDTVELSEADIAQLVRREIKQREEAIGFAEKGAREDLVAKNRSERDFLAGFLPQALSTEDLEAAVRRHVESGATQIGAVMAKLKEEFGSRLDGKTASGVVRDVLARRGGA